MDPVEHTFDALGRSPHPPDARISSPPKRLDGEFVYGHPTLGVQALRTPYGAPSRQTPSSQSTRRAHHTEHTFGPRQIAHVRHCPFVPREPIHTEMPPCGSIVRFTPDSRRSPPFRRVGRDYPLPSIPAGMCSSASWRSSSISSLPGPFGQWRADSPRMSDFPWYGNPIPDRPLRDELPVWACSRSMRWLWRGGRLAPLLAVCGSCPILPFLGMMGRFAPIIRTCSELGSDGDVGRIRAMPSCMRFVRACAGFAVCCVDSSCAVRVRFVAVRCCSCEHHTPSCRGCQGFIRVTVVTSCASSGE